MAQNKNQTEGNGKHFMDKILKNKKLLLLSLCMPLMVNMVGVSAAPGDSFDGLADCLRSAQEPDTECDRFRSRAPTVSDRFLKSVDIVDDIHRSEVTIEFTYPLRYEQHFPLHRGKELRIRLRPINVAAVDIDSVFERESLVPRPTDLVPLSEVIYEGDFSADGLYLQLYFDYEVAFGVEQGSDYRSIVVYVCEKEFSNKLKRCLD